MILGEPKILVWTKRDKMPFALDLALVPLKPNESRRADFIRRGGATERYGAFAYGESGASAVCPDEVKLIRAQGECLGIRNR